MWLVVRGEVGQMPEQASEPCADLLREWQLMRELVHTYSRSLMLLALDGPSVHVESRRELNEKLDRAILGLRPASDQLHACERERVLQRRAR